MEKGGVNSTLPFLFLHFKGKSSKDYSVPFLDNGGKGIKFLLRQLQGF
jgi:hypothetical protein